MSRHLILAWAVCFAISACGRTAPNSGRSHSDQRSAETAVVVSGEEFTIGEPVRHANLTVFPVLTKLPRTDDRFLTLNEGLKAGTVEIFERGALPATIAREESARSRPVSEPGGTDEARDADADRFDDINDVNRLLVVNRDKKPLYLMPGEVIVGGSQDRAIAEETVIAATGKAVSVEVYCVEPGRWGTRDDVASAALFDEVAEEGTTPGSLSAGANAGKFVVQTGSLSKASRLAVHAGAGQEKVWEEVAKANEASGAASNSGAFTANYADKEVLARMQPYLDALTGPVSRSERVVGVVVAINGKIETVDVFEATPLFLKLWPHLLKSIALDALDVADADDAEKATSVEEAAGFVASLQDQSDATSRVEGGLIVSRRETRQAFSFSAGMGAMGGMGMGGFGGAIHSSSFSK
jgi:hypothetical protein